MVTHIHKFITLLAVLYCLQVLSYFAVKKLGARLGLLLTSFLAGFVSSTSVVIHHAHRAAKNPYDRHFIPSVMYATSASLVLLLIILGMASDELMREIMIPVSGMAGITFISGFVRWVKKDKTKPHYELEPVNFKQVLKQALFLIFLYVMVSFAQKTFGASGARMASFLSGLFELHGLSMATAQLFFSGGVSLIEAKEIIFIGVIASYISKSAIALSVSRNSAGVALFILNLLIVGLGVSLYKMF